MKLKVFSIYLSLLLFFSSIANAVEPLPNNLIALTSPQGFILFKKNANENSLKLLSHFITQKTLTYCGVASTVMVLNANEIIAPLDSKHPPYYYFNQENFFNDNVKKIISIKEVKQQGITLAQLSQIIDSYGLEAQPFFANKVNLNDFRQKLKKALTSKQYVIVNYLRSNLQQLGAGHFSLLAAYDEETDMFLVLDVARFKYPAFWVKAEDLWKSVDTMDNDSYRGFIIIKNRLLMESPVLQIN